MSQQRETGNQILKKMSFPLSPSFVNYAVKNPNEPPKTKQPKREGSLASVVEFCKKQNIPFIDAEDRFYKFKQGNQSIKIYQTYLNKCFETSRPDEYEIGARLLSEPIPLSRIKKDINNTVQYDMQNNAS